MKIKNILNEIFNEKPPSNAVVSEETGISDAELRKILKDTLFDAGNIFKKVLILPPDYSRLHSGGGKMTAMLYDMLKDRCEVHIMPAIGTHEPVSPRECAAFFGPDIPHDKLIVHDWRNDVVKLGEVPAEFIEKVSEGLMDSAIDVEVNRRIVDESYDLILSLGQVVPHEVAGMSNHNKNVFVGCGGSAMINASHMLGAFYGLERMMGKADTPVRRVFDYAEDHFLEDVPLVYVLTVTTAVHDEVRIHGVFTGSDRTPFEEAVKLSRKKNIIAVEKPLRKAVAYLDGREFKSTWIGNKAVYRTRLAMEHGGALLILAPGVNKFGEDPENDKLIRKYGYAGRENVLALFRDNEDLRMNQSVPAHLIHGSSDGNFSVTYATKHLSREEVEGVHFQYQPYDEAAERYDPEKLQDGFNTMPDGEEIYFISNPALGLWAYND